MHGVTVHRIIPKFPAPICLQYLHTVWNMFPLISPLILHLTQTRKHILIQTVDERAQFTRSIRLALQWKRLDEPRIFIKDEQNIVYVPNTSRLHGTHQIGIHHLAGMLRITNDSTIILFLFDPSRSSLLSIRGRHSNFIRTFARS